MTKENVLETTEKEGSETREVLGVVLKQFMEETSIHGVKNSFDGRKSRPYRFVWIILGMAAIAVLLMSLHTLYVSYIQFPVQTVVHVNPTDHLPFPAITICNINGLEMSKLRAQDTPTYNVSAALVTLSIWSSSLSRTVNASELNKTMPFVINSTLLNATFQDISRQAFTDLHSTLKLCSWDNKEENCADMFQPVDMDARRCFQFNGNTPAKAPRRASRINGLNSGLEVIVNVRQDEYFVNQAVTLSAGAQIILHEPGEVPDKQKGFMASPGFSHYAKTVLKKYQYLPEPYKAFGKEACVSNVDLTSFELDSFQNATYTHALCRHLCVDGLTQKHCRCRLSNGSFTIHPALPLCTVKDVFTCYISTYENMTKWHNNADCPCPRLCHMTNYDVTVSSAYFPSTAAQGILHQLNLIDKNKIRQNVFVLKVFYDELLYYEMTHVPQYTLQSVVGIIGGQMGLFIGASLLSLVELVHLLLTVCLRGACAVYSKSLPHKVRVVTKQET